MFKDLWEDAATSPMITFSQLQLFWCGDGYV